MNNEHCPEVLAQTLMQLDLLQEHTTDQIHLCSIVSLRKSILKHQIDNSHHINDTWKQYAFTKSQTGGRPKKCINRYVLEYLISIDMKNTKIANIFDVHRNVVARWKVHHRLTNVLQEPEDDNAIISELKEVYGVNNSLGELNARRVFLSKGIKIKRKRLRSILKVMKNPLPLQISNQTST